MNNQGKTTQQYKDSAMFAFIGYLGILLVSIISIGSCGQPTQPPQDEWDQGECGDTLIDNTLDMDCGDSDEDKMWIGGNGDTIWE